MIKYCLIGEESIWTFIIQERLFLNKTIYFIDCNLQQGQLKMKLIESTYELFLNLDAIKKQLSTNKFDRIILLNCLHKINNTSISPINLLHKSLTKDGRLIIIYREPTMNTLPLPMKF